MSETHDSARRGAWLGALHPFSIAPILEKPCRKALRMRLLFFICRNANLTARKTAERACLPHGVGRNRFWRSKIMILY